MKTNEIKAYLKKLLKSAKEYAVKLIKYLNKIFNSLIEYTKNMVQKIRNKYSNKEKTKQVKKDFNFKFNPNIKINKLKKERKIKFSLLFIALLIFLPLYNYGKENNFGLDVFAQNVDYSYSDNKINSQIITGSDTTNLNIDWYNGNITIKTSTSSYFKFEEYSDDDVSGNNYFDAQKNSGVLNVTWNEYDYYDNINKSLIIYVPEDLDDLEICINTKNSYIDISDMELYSIEINMDDGDVYMQNLVTDAIDIDANDANVELTSLEATTVNIKTNNGNIGANGYMRNIYASSVYGEIKTLNSREFDTLDISSVAGDIYISVPKTSSFIIKVSEVLGNLLYENFEYDENSDILYYGDLSSASYYKVTTTYSDINFSFTY